MSDVQIHCGACGRPMVRRRNSQNGSEFMACLGWTERDDNDQPRCAETARLPEYVRMLEAGAAQLPGF